MRHSVMSRGPYSTENRDIPLLIRECRISAGFTQEQLADALETSQGTVARWERGEVDLSVRKLLQIAAFLNVPAAELIKDGDGLSPTEKDLIDHLRSHPKDRLVIESTLNALKDTADPPKRHAS